MRKEQEDIKVLGLMSGTSCDGVDMAVCSFNKTGNNWHFNVLQSETCLYEDKELELVQLAYNANGREIIKYHFKYGEILGRKITKFIQKNNSRIDYIASHGHTIFHAPEQGYTFQLGHGAAIAAATGIPVICDFRSKNISLGGQGAPLVPIGDKLLFKQYGTCINLGGFSNISFDTNRQRKAFDIGPANMALNYLAKKAGMTYDKNGQLAKTGSLNKYLLDRLNKLTYYKNFEAKSIGKEWFDKVFIPQITNTELPVADLLATVTEHIAYQIARALDYAGAKKALFTGGGAHNTYLMERIGHNRPCVNIIVPNTEIVDFKESIVFAFLGRLYLLGENNIYKSYTGSKYDCIGGALYV